MLFSVPPEQSGFAWSVFVSEESVYSYFGAQNSKVHLILRYFQWKSNRLFSDTYYFRHILLLTRSSSNERTVVKYAKSPRPSGCFTARILDFLALWNLFEP